MATHDYVLDNATGANFRSDLNNALAAIVSNNSSSSEPSTKYAYQWWADTNEGVLKIRNSSNDGWVTLLQLDGTLTLEDGSASAPALGFRDDLNTGIFSSAADTLDVTCGGTTRGSFSSSGLTVTGNVTATTFVGNIDAVDGDFDGTLEADAITVAGVALSTVIAGTTVTTATNANHVSVADNESTNENNLIPFIEDASATGNVGLESDGDFTYNPSTGTVTATAFSGSGASLTALNIVTDTSPQLGGNLDGNDKNILLNDSSGSTNNRIRLGASQDFALFHNGTYNIIEAVNGNLHLRLASSEEGIIAKQNGAVELYFDNSKKFETYSNGCTVTGNLNADNVDLADNAKARFGTGNDLTLEHNGTLSKILNESSRLIISGSASDNLDIMHTQSEYMASFIPNGAVELYHNNSKKIETTSTGIDVTGAITVNGSALATGGGKILQVVQTTKTDTFSTSSQSYTDVTGLSVSITPTSSSSKIFIILDIKVGAGHEDAAFAGRLVRGSTAIYVGDAASNRTQASFGTSRQSGNAGYDIIQDRQAVFLDSPSTTSATTYKVQIQGNNGRNTLVNRTSDDSDDDDTPRVASSITVMEVSA